MQSSEVGILLQGRRGGGGGGGGGERVALTTVNLKNEKIPDKWKKGGTKWAKETLSKGTRVVCLKGMLRGQNLTFFETIFGRGEG